MCVVSKVRGKVDGIYRGNIRNSPSTTSNGLLAGAALPDADSLSLDAVLAAEGAGVSGVLGDFHLLDLLTEGGTVSLGIRFRQHFMNSQVIIPASISGRSLRFVLIGREDGEGGRVVVPHTVFTGN
jgi:hypothetical protein